MGEQIYNTEHGYFLLKNDHKHEAREALEASCHCTFDRFDDALDFIGFNCAENDEGDVIDIFLASSNTGEDDWKRLKECVGPFVEVGSQLIFFNATSCFAIVFLEGKEPGTVEAAEDDVECVPTYDMDRILSVLADTGNDLWMEMNKKYGTGEIEGEHDDQDEEEDGVPQDGESDVEVHTNSDINKGED